jgi:hypothetical protein
MPVLPTDPANNVSYYYTYVSGGSYELLSLLESERYLKSSAMKDKGIDPGRMEMGTDLSLWEIPNGLVGYWGFDEGNGTIAYDSSKNGNNGTVSGAIWMTRGSSGALSFSGSGDYVRTSFRPTFRNALTSSIWIKRTTGFNQLADVMLLSPAGSWFFYDAYNSGGVSGYLLINGVSQGHRSVPVPFDSNWYHIVYTYDSVTRYSKMYKNGVLVSSIQLTGLSNYLFDLATNRLSDIGLQVLGRGLILDEPRIYNRALSASEIEALYKATK